MARVGPQRHKTKQQQQNVNKISSGKCYVTETGLVLIYLKSIIANPFPNSVCANVNKISSGKCSVTETGLVLIYLKSIIANPFPNSTCANVCFLLEPLI